MVNVFAFCLYGPINERYYPKPMLQNIALVGKYYPEWKVYIYVAPDVDQDFLHQVAMYSNVVLRHTNHNGPINMIHRFFAIDEPGVDMMLVRDADSRVHWKDRWAINQFIKNPMYIAHTIRDNKEHTAFMMGGLWGLRKSAGLIMQNEYIKYVHRPAVENHHGHDQDFLSFAIYPKISSKTLVHYSNGRFLAGESAVEFPFPYTNDIYCGRIEDDTFQDSPQPGPDPKSIRLFPFLSR